MSVEWFEAVSAASTVVLTGFTFYYVRLTHSLLKIQVEPLVEFFIDSERLHMVVKNYGAYAVWNVSTEYNIRVLPGPVELYGKTAKLPLVEKLRAGKSHKISIEQLAGDTVQMRKLCEQTLSAGDSPAQAFVRLSLSWQRDFDRRVFKAVLRFEVVQDANTDRCSFRPLVTQDPVLDEFRICWRAETPEKCRRSS